MKGDPMRFSVKSIYIKLSEHIREAGLFLAEADNPYVETVRFFSDLQCPLPSDAAKNALYIYAPGRTAALPAAFSFPVLVSEKDSHLFSGCPKIVIPDDFPLYDAFNLIMSVFQQYNDWAVRVGNAVLKNQSLQDILDLTAPLVGNPMYIADLSFKMLAYINMDLDEISAIWRYQIRYGYLPYNVMMDLSETGELELLNNTLPAFYLNSKCFNNPFISKTIRYRGKTQGHFYIIEIYKKLTQCDIEIADYLGELLSTATHNKRNYLTISSFYHEHFMVDILENTLTDSTLIRHQLSPLGWKLEGNYRIFLLCMPGDEDALKRHIMAFLLDGFDAQAFLYKDYLVAIYKSDGCSIQHLCTHLGKLSEAFNRCGALSEVFRRFDRMFLYYQQSEFALREGPKYHAEKRFFLYEDYFPVHLTQLCESGFPCYQPVELLNEYDNTHHTQYCLTLFTYLVNERNTVKTAQTLYLHRNTLKYRIEKIEELMPLDLDSPGIRFRTLSSLYTIIKPGV